MDGLNDKELIEELQKEIKKTSGFLEDLKRQFRYMELIRFVTVYIAILLTIVVIWYIWY